MHRPYPCRRLTLALLVLLLCGPLAGCGAKGDLTLPPSQTER